MSIKKTCLLLVFFLLVPVGFGFHTVATKTGHSVSHSHYSTCQGGCISDTGFEDDYGILRSDRIYAGTWSWNCHGRTFANRSCWVSYADTWLDYDAPFTPASPQIGDVVIWFSGGVTSHSATIVGSWNGTNTLVMSKYGAQGQYKHKLINCVNVYGSNWAVTRFGAGTTIYQGKTAKEIIESLQADRKKMPWYKDVLESEREFQNNGLEIIQKITEISQRNRESLENQNDIFGVVDVLFEDLLERRHYMPLNLFNLPAHSEAYIVNLEAGEMIVNAYFDFPEAREYIEEKFVTLLKEDLGELNDGVKSSLVYFYSELMSEFDLKNVREIIPIKLKNQSERYPHINYYLEKIQK